MRNSYEKSYKFLNHFEKDIAKEEGKRAITKNKKKKADCICYLPLVLFLCALLRAISSKSSLKAKTNWKV